MNKHFEDLRVHAHTGCIAGIAAMTGISVTGHHSAYCEGPTNSSKAPGRGIDGGVAEGESGVHGGV